ncbi:MAG: cob(I)yrinic acid a,c-diamide adenosyltransferase [Candidatus Limisoma sp.]|nr:cob(I)yrinic acid a,c-diamide adenosyltransferase [Candidatus Limisoma sp.]
MTKKSLIYTATGDAGTTSLVGGKRVDKDDIRLEAYGTVDELNAHVGLLDNLHNVPSEMKDYIRVIQNKLFNIGAYLATETAPGTPAPGLDAYDVKRIEEQIDFIDSELPPLRNFVLPGGSKISSRAHICRTVARRCERRVVTLSKICPIDKNVLTYLNRLSDYFFVLARFNNIHNQIDEIFWDKDCK